MSPPPPTFPVHNPHAQIVPFFEASTAASHTVPVAEMYTATRNKGIDCLLCCKSVVQVLFRYARNAAPCQLIPLTSREGFDRQIASKLLLNQIMQIVGHGMILGVFRFGGVGVG